MSSQTETATNNRTTDISVTKKVGKESSKKVPTGDVESKNTSPFPTEENSVSTPNSLFNPRPELPNMSQTNNNEIVPSQVEENNKKVEGKKSKPKKVSHLVLDATDASLSQKPKAKKAEPIVPPPIEEEDDDEEKVSVVPVATQMGIPVDVDETLEDQLQEDMDNSPRNMISSEMFGVASVADAEVAPTPIAPAELEEDDEDVELARQMAKIKQRQEEKARQKQVKQQVSKASIYRDELSAETRSLSFDICQDLEMRIQEAIRVVQELEGKKNDEERQRDETLQQLRDATDEQIVEFYNQREARKKPMAKSSKTTTKKATTLASISAGGGGGSDDGSEGKKEPRERSKIERNLERTFENCGTIVITEEYLGAKTSITLTRNRHQRTWKSGAWMNEGTAVASPNDAWKDMIRERWGEGGLKKFNGKNVWEKAGRMVATSNSGKKYDMAKNPMMIMMDLAKCKGVYNGRKFEDLTDEDFTQIV